MLKEFKAFIAKGNVLDMAVGVIIGIAFGSVITSLVNDVIMPPIGLLLGKMDFSSLFVNLSGTQYATLAAAKAAGAPVIAYGAFINALINFVIIAFVVFLIVRAANRMREPAAAPKECQFCKSKIAQDATRCPNCTSEL